MDNGVSHIQLRTDQCCPLLRIETGHYARNRIDRALCLCTLCDKSDLEDEYHFVLFFFFFFFFSFMIQ